MKDASFSGDHLTERIKPLWTGITTLGKRQV